MPRSGSTWLYNAARLLLKRRPDPVYGAWIERWDTAHPAPVHVVKIHEPDEVLSRRAWRVLTSRRDLRDIAASALRRGWTVPEQVFDFIEGVVRMHAWWKGRSACEIAYERLVGEPQAQIARLGRTLGLAVTDEDAAEVRSAIDALRAPLDQGASYDEHTLLHPGHVSAAPAPLPAELAQALTDRFGPWLREFGYEG
jgi:hypothetical protein